MKFRRFVGVIVSLVFLAWQAEPARAQQTLYAITNSGQLFTVNPISGASVPLAGPSVTMSAVGLGIYNGYVITFDNLIGGFRLLDSNTGQIVGSPIYVSGLGPLGGDGDFCFNANGMGFIVDGGFVPNLRSFNLATLTSTPVTIPPGFPNLRGMAADATDPNRLYGLDNVGNFFLITNAPTGFANVAVINNTGQLSAGAFSSYSFGGLAVTTANGMFSVDNWANLNSLRQVNPGTGAILNPDAGGIAIVPFGLSSFSGLTFGASGSPPPPPPPPPPPSGGGGGGSGGGGFGGEGHYGFGFTPNTFPILLDPFRESPIGPVNCADDMPTSGNVVVRNVANRQQLDPQAGGLGGGAIFAWALTVVSGLLVALGAIKLARTAISA